MENLLMIGTILLTGIVMMYIIADIISGEV